MLGGRDVNLDALPGHPGFTFDWSVFIDSVLFSSTRFAKFLFNISLASGVPVRFCGANGNASLIIRFFFDVVGIVGGFFSGSGTFPLTLPDFEFSSTRLSTVVLSV